MINLDHIFREYDLRGLADTELDEAFAERLGWAFAAHLVERTGKRAHELCALVARDVRPSSPRLRDALVGGITSSGIRVLDAGETATPVFYFGLFTEEVDGGVQVTASHNPSEYNGFKVAVGRETISGDEIRALRARFESITGPLDAETRGGVGEIDIDTPYFARLREEFAYLAELPPLRVAADAGNGMAGPYIREAMSFLGVESTCLYCDPDGRFPNHHPDPTVLENLRVVRQVVIDERLDLALAFDGDGDRLGVLDEKGDLIYGDRLLYVFAQAVLLEEPGATVVGEVKCSQALFDAIEAWGGKPIMWKAGHSLIKKKMREVGAALGGEMSGHYFFADRYYGFDDSVYAACRTIELAKKARQRGMMRISEHLAAFPEFFATEEIRVECSDDAKADVVRALAERLPEIPVEGFALRDVVTIDGVRLNYDHGWALVRQSNTQPALVLRFEADTPTGAEVLRKSVFGALDVAKKDIGC